jgi:aryl-alcohol dehydrogenase-like predicted oxidoreductase
MNLHDVPGDIRWNFATFVVDRTGAVIAPSTAPSAPERRSAIAGINYIDTSIDYGVSEERIGRYIGARRSEYYLASKCGCLVGAAPAPRGQTSPHVFTRDNILKGVEQSLARMRTG